MKFIKMLYTFIFCFLPMLIASQEILKYSIEEKQPINTLIVDFTKELNLPKYSTFKLSELLPIHRNLLYVDSETGHLRTNMILDREELCSKQQCSCESCEVILQLLIQMSGTSIEKILEIKLKDRNDHVPTFGHESGRHLIHIKENVPLGYRIVLPSATDPDEGSNSVQSYSLTGTSADDFDVDFTTMTTPFLIVRSSLDRQRVSSYSLTLIASDHGQQPKPHSTSIQLDIRILSLNESIPNFPQSVYSIDVREDVLVGSSLLTVTATSENPSIVSYEFLTSSPFTIDSSTGEIRLNQSLDYEREKLYRLTVKAHADSMPAYAVIFIRVIDVNDNSVTIRIKAEGNATMERKSLEQYTLSIEEQMPAGTKLAQLILNDLDSSANGNPYLQLRTDQYPLPFVYKLIYQHPFQNTKFYSLIINQLLDREVKSIYNHLQLIAHDSGTPTLHTQLRLTLNVTDINDCTPTFHMNTTIYSINENNPIGLLLGKLSAHDCDAAQNGQINYRLLNDTNLFLVNEQTGEIRMNLSVDFEKINVEKSSKNSTIDLEFYVEARDQGKPSLSSQMKIILRIHDLNDNPPEFNANQSYNWTFSKKLLQPGAVLGRIVAHDQDSGVSGLVHYSLRSFSPCVSLEMTPLGYIYVPSDASILMCPYDAYEFEIIATDSSLPQSHSTRQLLKINIDSNDSQSYPLPQLLPLDIEQTTVDVNSMGKIAFVLDLTTFSTETYQPKLIFNNTHLSSSWNVNPDGEIRLISHPYASSYILSMIVIDEFTQVNVSVQLQIKVCNSSIAKSCENGRITDNRTLLVYAIGSALIVTLVLIAIFSLVICLCCRRTSKKSRNTLNSIHNQSFLRYMEEYNNEKMSQSNTRRQSSSNSTVRDDDHDSACIIPGNSASSSASTSSSIPTHSDSWRQSPEFQRESLVQAQPYSSAYQYDLKLAEFLRHNQYPPCVHLNEPSSMPQSTSTDYGFSSLELSVTSSISTLPHHSIDMDQNSVPERLLTLHSFVSSRECVV